MYRGSNDEDDIAMQVASGRVFQAEGIENIKPLSRKQAWFFWNNKKKVTLSRVEWARKRMVEYKAEELDGSQIIE